MIEGKVARIINTRELAINVGAGDGVKTGMIFAVLAAEPLEIKDPDSGTKLGEIDREKVRVRVSEVHESFSICRTYGSRTVGSGLLASALFEGAFGQREVPITLKAEDSALPPPLSEADSYVKAKDRVRQVEDN
jgi:hypothetical protein